MSPIVGAARRVTRRRAAAAAAARAQQTTITQLPVSLLTRIFNSIPEAERRERPGRFEHLTF